MRHGLSDYRSKSSMSLLLVKTNMSFKFRGTEKRAEIVTFVFTVPGKYKGAYITYLSFEECTKSFLRGAGTLERQGFWQELNRCSLHLLLRGSHPASLPATLMPGKSGIDTGLEA